MTQTLAKTEFQTCFGCDYGAITAEKHCPRCDKPLQNAVTIRVIGGALTAIGLFLSIIAGASMISIYNVAGDPAKWRGSSEQTNIVYAVLTLLLAFGLSALINGGWHLITGKYRRKLHLLMIGVGLGLWILIEIVMLFVGLNE